MTYIILYRCTEANFVLPYDQANLCHTPLTRLFSAGI